MNKKVLFIKKKLNKGFTLVELLAVIVILAVVVIIGVISIVGNLSQAKTSSLESAGKIMVKYLDDNYSACVMYKDSTMYDNTIFDERCDLIYDNISENLLLKNGYSPDDIESLEVSVNQNGEFGLKVTPNKEGKYGESTEYSSPEFLKLLYTSTCWEALEITGGDYDDTYKLIGFHGFDDKGNLKGECTGYITGNKVNGMKLYIPSILDDKVISSVGDVGLKKLSSSGININHISIDKDVKEIGSYAFKQSGISIVTFEGLNDGTSQLETIGSNAFQANLIENLKIPKSVVVIGNKAFNQNQITTLKFDGALDETSLLETIGESSFRDNKIIGELVIPKNVVTIGDNAFTSGNKITTLKFDGDDDGTSKLTSIGENAFRTNQITGELIIPRNVVTIEEEAFNQNQITTLEFDGALDETSLLETIGGSSFRNNNIIGELVIPKNVVTIGDNAFTDGNQITTLKFDGALDGTSKLKTIGINSFRANQIAGELIIPRNVVTIEKEAFNKNQLTTLKFDRAIDGENKLETIGIKSFYSNQITGELIIPKNVVTIGDNAFTIGNQITTLKFDGALDGTSKLKTIGIKSFLANQIARELIIPKSVVTIGDYAFYSSNLTSLTFVGAEDGTSLLETIGSRAFAGHKITGEIIVPPNVTLGTGALG